LSFNPFPFRLLGDATEQDRPDPLQVVDNYLPIDSGFKMLFFKKKKKAVSLF